MNSPDQNRSPNGGGSGPSSNGADHPAAPDDDLVSTISRNHGSADPAGSVLAHSAPPNSAPTPVNGPGGSRNGRPQLAPRPLWKPPIDPMQAGAFGRPRGTAGAFAPRQQRGPVRLGAPPVPEYLQEAFERPAGADGLTRPPALPDPDTAPSSGDDPWRDRGVEFTGADAASAPWCGSPSVAGLPGTELAWTELAGTRSASGVGRSAPFDEGPEPAPFGDRFWSGLFISRGDLSMAANRFHRPVTAVGSSSWGVLGSSGPR